MADATKHTALFRSHDLFPGPPGMCEKNILLLFRFSQPVEKNTYFINRLDCSFSSWKIYGTALAGFADLWNFFFFVFVFFSIAYREVSESDMESQCGSKESTETTVMIRF